MAVFDAMPNLDIVFGHSEQFISPELDDDFKKKVKIPTKILPCQTPCAFLVKKIAFEQVGLFNLDFRVGSEMDWYARLIDLKLSTFMMPEVLFYRRIHQNNSAQSNHDANFQRLRVLKGALDRRKAAGFEAK